MNYYGTKMLNDINNFAKKSSRKSYKGRFQKQST